MTTYRMVISKMICDNCKNKDCFQCSYFTKDKPCDCNLNFHGGHRTKNDIFPRSNM